MVQSYLKQNIQYNWYHIYKVNIFLSSPEGQSISHRVRKIPYTLEKLKFVSINLHSLKAAYPKWNYVILRIAPTKNYVTTITLFNILPN